MKIVLKILAVIAGLILFPLMAVWTCVWFPIDILHKIICGVTGSLGAFIAEEDDETK